MSIIKVNTITGIIDMPKDVRIKGGRLGVNFTVDSLGALPDSTSGDSFRPYAGDWFWDSANTTLKLYLNDSHGWKNIGLTDSAGVGGGGDIFGDRAILFNSSTGTGNASNIIEYYDITTPGNATDFGDLLETSYNPEGSTATNGTYAVYQIQSTTASYQLQYVTVATTGNATSFGENSLLNAADVIGNVNEGTYSYFARGNLSGNNYIGVISPAVPGNMADTGYSLSTEQYGGHGCGNTTYGLFGGGYDGGSNVTICYITYASLADAVDFGDQTTGRYNEAAVSSDTRGVWAGGYISSGSNIIEYVTIDTPGNATDFGDLTQGRYPGSAGNGTYGTFMGGYTGSTRVNIIDYITIATTGNASDFGDLTNTSNFTAGTSGNPA